MGSRRHTFRAKPNYLPNSYETLTNRKNSYFHRGTFHYIERDMRQGIISPKHYFAKK